jgi:hypothetical protein
MRLLSAGVAVSNFPDYFLNQEMEIPVAFNRVE